MITTHVHDIDLVIKKIKNMGGPNATKVLIDTINDAMREDVYPLWIRNISLDDHTLADLRKAGHPYATRYGKDSFAHPDFDVHRQSGGLLTGSSIIEASSENPRVVINESAPEYVYLRYGTSVMRIRDPGGEAMAEALPAIRRRFASRFPYTYLEIIGK